MLTTEQPAVRAEKNLAKFTPQQVHARLEEQVRSGDIAGGGAAFWVWGREANESEIEFGVRRRFPDAPNNASIHDTFDEIYHIIHGSAILITGGQRADPEDRTKGIVGGEIVTINAGDYLVVPAGMLHWMTEIQDSITYSNIRLAVEE